MTQTKVFSSSDARITNANGFLLVDGVEVDVKASIIYVSKVFEKKDSMRIFEVGSNEEEKMRIVFIKIGGG